MSLPTVHRARLPAADLAVRSRRALLVVLALASAISPARDAAAAAETMAAAVPASATWLDPVNLSSPIAEQPQVAIDEEGNAVAAWTRQSGTGRIVQAATRPAGAAASIPRGGWSEARDLSAAIDDVHAVDLAVDPGGNAIVIWAVGRVSRVQAATRPAGAPASAPRGGWSDPQDVIAPDEGEQPGFVGGYTHPQVALDGNGNAVALWHRGNADGARRVQSSTRRPGAGGFRTGDWSAPETLSADDADEAPALALNPRGDAVAIWSHRQGAEAYVVEARARDRLGAWSEPRRVSSVPSASPTSSSGRFLGARAALDPRGNAVAVWEAGGIVFSAARPAGGQWSAPEEVSSGASEILVEPTVAIDHQGEAVALWPRTISTSSDFEARIETARRSLALAGGDFHEGDWSVPRSLAPAEGNPYAFSHPNLAVDPSGDALAVWLYDPTQSPDGYRVQAAAWSGEAWSDTVEEIGSADINQAQLYPEVALDAQGNGVAVWTKSVAEGSVSEGCVTTSREVCVTMQAAGYDAAGPQLRELVVPAHGRPGATLSFSASPLDVWSSVASTTWGFGDETSAAGTRVSHTYASPGGYEVTVTSTDALGNSSSERRPVVVAAPAGGGGGIGNQVGSVAGTGTPQSGGGNPAGSLPGSERQRASALRRCLAGARRSSGARRRARRRRCIARYGRRPGPVRELRARVRSSTRIVLSFRAPGIDQGRGSPARHYLIKQSRRPFRGRRGFRRARSLCGGSCRLRVGRVGQRVRIVITDLRPNTTYYYAVAARDPVSRRVGPRSRTVRTRTR